MKRVLGLVLAFSLAFGGLSVSASVRGEAEVAGRNLAEVIELIMNSFVGDPVTVEQLFEAAMRGMTEELDEYSVYFTAAEWSQFSNNISGRVVGIGVTMRMRDDGRIVVDSVIANSPAERAGILAGDVFASVDGVSVAGLSTDQLRDRIVDSASDWVTVGVMRGNTLLSFVMQKGEVNFSTVHVNRLQDIDEAEGLANLQHFRYMQITSVGRNTANDVRLALSIMQQEGVRGIVLDLRGNSGGYLDVIVEIANMLVPQGTILQTVNAAGVRRVFSSNLQNVPFRDIVILVDERTASAAEVLASALQDSGIATVIGVQTYGKGLVQSIYTMGTGGALKITTEEYFRRSGATINGIGVIPQIIVDDEDASAVLRRGLEHLLR
ncbi:MAG: S41 family peptidase [Turicibacter sp.]|nr:S41 family peptidase [Turicibacter sp.]